jgi:hypothetical protein
MFTREQKNTLFIAALALIVGALLGLAGCNTEGKAATDGTAGAAGTAGTGGAAGSPGRGGSSCGAGETCGIAITYMPPQQENPCTQSYQGTQCGYGGNVVCGWDVAANECWTTTWCEPSVKITNTFVDVGQNGLRPASAVCPAGTYSYTYQPGTLLMWGTFSAYSTPLSAGVGSTDGYTCSPNIVAITVNC